MCNNNSNEKKAAFGDSHSPPGHVPYFLVLMTTTLTQEVAGSQPDVKHIQKQFYVNCRKHFACKTILNYLCLIQETLRRV